MPKPQVSYATSPEILRKRVHKGSRVLVLDDHQLLAQMLVGQLIDLGHEALAIDVADHQLRDRILEIQPDIVLLDAVFADDESAGMEILHHLRSESTAIDVVILTGVLEPIRHAEFLDAGALAVISKVDSFEQVTQQINDVLQGKDPMGATRRDQLRALLHTHRRGQTGRDEILAVLTASERSTLEGLVAGQSVQDMALLRTVAVSTVRSHVRAILRKLGAHSQIEAVAMAAKAGLEPRPTT